MAMLECGQMNSCLIATEMAAGMTSRRCGAALLGMMVDESVQIGRGIIVHEYYHDEWAAQTMARSSVFGYLTLAVIGANAKYMGAEWDLTVSPSLNEAGWGFAVLGNSFRPFSSR